MKAYIREEKIPELEWQLLGQTEMISNSLDPDFLNPFNISYYFEKNQLLKFEVLDYESEDKQELVGEYETSLGKLMGSKDQKLEQYLKLKGKEAEGKHKHKRGKIIIRAENVDGGNDELSL